MEEEQSLAGIAPVTIQKISFWPGNPAAWFRVIENQFIAAKVSKEGTMFNHAISMMDQDSINKCLDIIEGLPQEQVYTRFKEEIINRFAESEQSKLQRALVSVDLGDRKPSQLLCEMRALVGNSFSDEALKTLWLQRLPPQVRGILSVSAEGLISLSVLADKVIDTMSVQNANVSSVGNLSNIEAQIGALTKKFEQMERRSRNTFRDRSGSRNPFRYRSRSSSYSDKICYYHRKFGINATKCKKPCNYSTPSRSSQLRSQTSSGNL